MGFSNEKIDFESIFDIGKRVFIDIGEEGSGRKNGKNTKERFH